MNGIYDYRLPSPALREYVRLFQIVACEFPTDLLQLPVKAYWPRAENSIAFYPKDTEKIQYGFDNEPIKKPRSTINGQYSIVTNRHVGRDFMVFQVQFQPCALHRLTGIPSYELANSFIDAEAIFSKEIRLVNERLSYTNHYTEMISIVEDFLMYLINKSRKRILPIDQVSRIILKNKGNVSLDWLADQACVSQRQFYRQFIEREGVSPKLFSRITRFDHAVRLKNAHPHKDWLTIALELGYYDYQHLVRDFKDFTNLTPNGFLVVQEKGPERTFGRVEV